MPLTFRATTDSDERLDRIPPDVTDVVTKAVSRCHRRRAEDPDYGDCDDIIETELDALASLLRVMLQEGRAKRLGLGAGIRSDHDEAEDA